MIVLTRASLASLVIALGWSPTSFAQTGACIDSDGDGYGWDGVATCLVGDSANSESSGNAGACVDSDGDGYGWDGVATCIVGAAGSGSQSAGNDSACVDSDGDGYGWNGVATCLVGESSTSTPSGNSGGSGACVDSDGDGYGWDGVATCLVGGGLQNDGSNQTDNDSTDAGQEDTNSDQDNNNDFGSNTGGTTYTSTLTPISGVQSDQCLTRQDTIDGNYPGAIRAGDFILSINAWNFGAAGNYNWEQCIFANGSGLGWTYDWGAGGGSGDFFVRSYPELIFGVKSGGEISGDSSREGTGLPERIDRLPLISIDYDFSGNENGPSRAVDASANPRFPNGTIINGERNIAIESFFHPSDANGNCPASVVQRGNGQSNHTYEIMVWIDSGAERLPAGPNDFVTNINLDGANYDVYTKDNDRKYVAFVRTSPSRSGRLNWSTFIEWTSDNAHRVSSLYGANTDSVKLQDTWCLANILVGNEIWWGRGDFTINQWQINRTY